MDFLEVFYFMILGVMTGIVYVRWILPLFHDEIDGAGIIAEMRKDVLIDIAVVGIFVWLMPKSVVTLALIFIGKYIYLLMGGINAAVAAADRR